MMIAQFSIFVLDFLLAATLVYLIVLMRKLKAFQAYKTEMTAIVDHVMTATDAARDSISKLKTSVIESQSSMAQSVDDARQIEKSLASLILDARLAHADLDLDRLKSGARQPVDRRSYDDRSNRDRDHAKTQAHHADDAMFQNRRGEGDDREKKAPGQSLDRDIETRIASLNDAVAKLRGRVAIGS